MRKKLIQKSTESSVKIGNELIYSYRPDFSVMELNVLYYAFSKFKKEAPEGSIYKLEIKELEKMTNCQMNYKQVRNAALSLKSKLYHIRRGKKLDQLTIIKAFKHKVGSGSIEVELFKDLYPYFGLKENFTTFYVSLALKLKNKYSRLIYEMLCRWQDTGIMVISVKELKMCLGLIDPKTGKEKYTEFGLLVTKVLDPAKKEIEEQTNISFTYDTERTGKKITGLRFYIKTKSNLVLLKNHTSGNLEPINEPTKKSIEDKKSPKREYQKLPTDQAQVYIELAASTDKGGLGWLKSNKALAHKLVTHIPLQKLHQHMSKIKTDVRNGKLDYSISSYFTDLLAVYTKEEEFKGKSDPREELIFSIFKKLIHQVRISLSTSNSIIEKIKASQTDTETLKCIWDEISEAIRIGNITNKEEYIVNKFESRLN